MKKFYDLGTCLGARASKNVKHLIAKCKGFSSGIHRPAVLVLTIVALTVTQFVWAEDVTPEEALRQAQDFMQQRVASGSRPRKAQGTLQLTPTQQVSGLYIFNVADDGGFVIVSNDDRTVPVLGFSDSGCIDPDNMPENMKAWLQGYADEIAWLATRNDQTTNSPNNRSKAPSRVGSHDTTPIAPLIATKWDQGKPYNNLCPLDGSLKSVTGCLATAIAQVMKYHEGPAGPTTEIPGYECTSLGKTLEDLPATTFDWANMLNDYSGKASSAQINAVAQLMQYCGWGMEMLYSAYGSYAITTAGVYALINYFGYKSTTQYVSRTYYSFANWTDLIYHELSEKRPVVYCGVTKVSNDGHSFICDGYKCELGNDMFHMNWGWSGNSDGYFVLTSLDPAEQGTGGSGLNEGFNTAHHAIIGIQKPSDTGNVLDVKENIIDLTLNSVTLSSNNITLGESVDITLNITNDSEDAFDGELIIVVTLNGNMSLAASDMFLIPSQDTQDCVLTFTPTATGIYTIGVGYPRGDGYYDGSADCGVTLIVVDANISLLNDDSSAEKKNTSLIDTWNLHSANVTLSGRTFLKNGSWNTICLPFNVTIEDSPLAGATVKKLTASTSGLSGTTLTLNFEDETTTKDDTKVTIIKAGTPYLIKWDSGEDLVDPTFYCVTINNMVRNVKSKDGKVTFKGTYKAISYAEEDRSILFLGPDNTLYYPEAGASINACRSYFSIAAGSSVKEYKLDFGDGEEYVDGIENVQCSMFNVQCDDGWYSLSGHRLSGKPTAKGIYIENGKKVVVK